MDPELREALERLENRVRDHVDATAAGLRDDIHVGAGQTRGDIDTTAVGLREHIAQSIEAANIETRRHMGVVAEGLRSDFWVATEGIVTLNRKFDTFQVEQEQTRRRLDLPEARVSVLERRRPRPRRPR